jgi:HEAT repeat protein
MSKFKQYFSVRNVSILALPAMVVLTLAMPSGITKTVYAGLLKGSTNLANVISAEEQERIEKRVAAIASKYDAAYSVATAPNPGIENWAEIQRKAQENLRIVQDESGKEFTQLGPGVIPVLLKLKDTRGCGWAVPIVIENLGEGATEPILEYLKNGGQNYYVFGNYFKNEGTRGTDRLASLLSSPSAKVRETGAMALGDVLQYGASISPSTMHAICIGSEHDESSRVRSAFLCVLGRIGPRDSQVRSAIVHALNSDPDASVRSAAVTCLQEYCRLQNFEHNDEITKLIIEALLHDESPTVRGNCANTLAATKLNPALVIPALQQSLHDNYSSVQDQTIAALSRYGSAASPVVPDLIKLMQAGSPKTAAIATTLAQIGPAAHDALPDLDKLLENDDIQVRASAITAESGIRREAYVPVLMRLLFDSDWQIQNAAVSGLSQLGAKAHAASGALKELEQQTKNQNVKYTVQNALRMIDGS